MNPSIGYDATRRETAPKDQTTKLTTKIEEYDLTSSDEQNTGPGTSYGSQLRSRQNYPIRIGPRKSPCAKPKCPPPLAHLRISGKDVLVELEDGQVLQHVVLDGGHVFIAHPVLGGATDKALTKSYGNGDVGMREVGSAE